MKICIDAGHGGSDTGASFKGVDEADIVLLVALYLEKLLERAGHEVILTRSIDEFIELGERAATANTQGADIFLSLHCNADPDDDSPGTQEGRGEEIFIYPDSDKGRRLAEALRGCVDGIFPGHRFRGIKEANYAVLRKTRMPAALVELGFIDNMKECQGLSRPGKYKRIAELLAKGIEKYAG